MTTSSTDYALIPPADEEFDDDDDSEDEEQEAILARVENFTIEYDADKEYRGKETKILSFARPHMRAFHGSWMLFCCAWLIWFSLTPLLGYIHDSLSSPRNDWTGNILSLCGAVVLRLVLGPLCDQYGARRTITCLIAVCALVLGSTGLIVQSYGALLLVRSLIGCVGGALVPAQYWITSHFVREICGTTMAVVAGWGAMGGGIAQIFMGTLVFPTVNYLVNDDEDLAWRLSLLVPASISLFLAFFFYYKSDDCPLGSYTEVKRAGLMQEKSAVDSFRAGAVNLNAWLLFFQFGASLGIELTMESTVSAYLLDTYNLDPSRASGLASLFGLMNVFARGLGGYLSDVVHKRASVRGRLVIHCIFMLTEGVIILVFNQCDQLWATLLTMVLFAAFGQMSMGTCFGLVPYVDPPNTGTIAGIVGAGGNVGGVWLSNVFRTHSYKTSFTVMGAFCIAMACLTPLIVIKGYRGIVFGTEKRRGEPALLLMPPSTVV